MVLLSKNLGKIHTQISFNLFLDLWQHINTSTHAAEWDKNEEVELWGSGKEWRREWHLLKFSYLQIKPRMYKTSMVGNGPKPGLSDTLDIFFFIVVIFKNMSCYPPNGTL